MNVAVWENPYLSCFEIREHGTLRVLVSVPYGSRINKLSGKTDLIDKGKANEFAKVLAKSMESLTLPDGYAVHHLP